MQSMKIFELEQAPGCGQSDGSSTPWFVQCLDFSLNARRLDHVRAQHIEKL